MAKTNPSYYLDGCSNPFIRTREHCFTYQETMIVSWCNASWTWKNRKDLFKSCFTMDTNYEVEFIEIHWEINQDINDCNYVNTKS